MWFAIVYICFFFVFILQLLGMMSARLYKYMLMQDITNSLQQVILPVSLLARPAPRPPILTAAG